MDVHATATIPKSLLTNFSLIDLDEVFEKYTVRLRGSKIGDEFIELKISGEKVKIRLAIKALYRLINDDYKAYVNKNKENPDVKKSLESLSDERSYQKKFNQIADAYMKHCALNDLVPHPEVAEDFVF